MRLFGRIPTRSMSADEFCPFVPPIWFAREIVQTQVFSELLILTTHHIGASGHAISSTFLLAFLIGHYARSTESSFLRHNVVT